MILEIKGQQFTIDSFTIQISNSNGIGTFEGLGVKNKQKAKIILKDEIWEVTLLPPNGFKVNKIIWPEKNKRKRK